MANGGNDSHTNDSRNKNTEQYRPHAFMCNEATLPVVVVERVEEAI